MSNKHFEEKKNSSEKENQEVVTEETTNLQEEKANLSEKVDEADKVSAELAELQKKYDELNNSHLRLRAEFDNYRKRTLREKSELIKNGGENALTQLLPVVDDFERALQNIHKAEDLAGVAEGVDLIYNKFISYLTSQGVKALEVVGKPFNIDQSEAIATIPAPEEGLKGKVLDCVQTGYMLNEKVNVTFKIIL